jgi:lipopolysaccharide transport system ATP-binding protein
MNANVLTVTGLSKVFEVYRFEVARYAHWLGVPVRPKREHWALRDVGFSIGRGEAVAVIGGNGAGKSTLLKIVTGTVAPTAGTVTLNGSASSILELGLDFNGDLTGDENVRLLMGLMGHSRREMLKILPEVREFAEIGDAFEEPLRTYSTGMRARVAFATATATRPDLLIVDEVLSVGDAYFRNRSFDRIRMFQQQGTAILFVTHGMGEAREVCSRAIWLDKGRVVADGEIVGVTDTYVQAQSGRQEAAA